jgi:tetratricopeptide (TPR) repeat protein
VKAPSSSASEHWWRRWQRRSEGGADTHGVADAENLLELAALERMIRRADGFRLAFGVANHPSLQERLVDVVKHDLQGRQIAEITLDPGAESVVSTIERAAQGGADAVFVYGLERLSPLRERSPGLFELNLNRDHLWRNVRVPVVFWAPDYAVRAFSRQAADSWSGRSGVYRFRPEADDETATSNLASDGLDWTSTPEERQERESLLRDLLEELDEHGGDASARASILASLGDAAQMQGRYEDAIALYEQALPLYRELGSRLGEANALKSLGDTAQMQGRYEDAIALYEQALPLHRELGDRLGEAQDLTSYGLALSAREEPSAESVLEEAARIFELIGLDERAAHLREVVTPPREPTETGDHQS